MRAEHWIYTIPLRVRSLFRRDQVELELDEELRYHIERQVEQYVAHGVPPQQARTAALRAMGGIERRKEEMRATRRVGFVEELGRDVRHAVRQLGRNPGFAAVALLTLMLGIGANTAIFTVVNGVLLRPLAYRDPSRLVVVNSRTEATMAPATFLDAQAASRSFESMGLAEYWSPTLTGRERAEQLVVLHLSPTILPMMGIAPMLGRVFTPEEEAPGRNRVIVLGYDLWNSHFAADRGVIDRVVTLDGEPYTVIGVMPPGFVFAPFWATEAQGWAPLVLDGRRDDRGGASLRAFARLAPNATLQQAQSELAQIGARLEAQYPGTGRGLTAVPLRELVVGDVEPALLILLATVGLVLLIACVNVAHLQLIRAASRERESAVRTALGASRRRLIQQWLTESALLSLAGGALGLLFAQGAVRLLVALAPTNIPRLASVAIDGKVVAFMLGVSAVAALISGVTPAVRLARVDPNSVLHEGGRGADDGRGRRRIRAALVVSEFALALVLLAGAGLVMRSFVALLRVDPGFDPTNVLSLRVSLAGTPSGEPARRSQFYRSLVQGTGALPGVVAVSAINHIPLNGDNWHFPYSVEGQPAARAAERSKALFRVVRPGYFRTMRIPLMQGRDVSAADAATAAHVVIVNEAMARREWPNESPLGRRISVEDPADGAHWFSVAGVVRDTRQSRWAEPTESEMFFPAFDATPPGTKPGSLDAFLTPGDMTLVLRASSSERTLARAVEEIVRRMDRDVPISSVLTMDEAIGQQLAQPRFYLWLFVAFAATALVLAAVGIYGVMSYSVARRTREIGIRSALGSGRGESFRLVVRQGMRLAALGTAIGLAGAFALTRFLRGFLFGVEPTDIASFAAVTVLLSAVALVACGVPAWRASKVDPSIALRSE